MDNRVITLSGIHNFRDYGGYRARGGALRTGMLWRSGQHCGATPEDLAEVHRLGIRTVIDLRGDSERQAYPCLRHEEFCGEVLFHPGETSSDKGAVHEGPAFEVRTAQDAHAAMLRAYAYLPFSRVLVETMRLFLAALATSNAPSLLHCLAGKDRTGIAAAIVHRLLGVHPDDVMADYLLTNTAGDAEARIAAGAKALQGNADGALDDATVRMLMSVQPEFLERAFAVMEERHGSVEDYARERLGADEALVRAMEARLVV